MNLYTNAKLNRLKSFLKLNPVLLKQHIIASQLNSPELLQRTNDKLNKAYENHKKLPSNPYTNEIPNEYVMGNLKIGNSTLDPDILIKSDLEKLQGHILSIGTTGSGKTHWILNILHQIISQHRNSNLRIIVFASKKGCEQRSLVLNTEPGSCLFLDKENLAINPLSSIKNINDEITIADASRVISNELGLLVGGQLYLQENLNQFYSTNPEENFLSFIDWISKKKETSYDLKGYNDRLVVRLKSLKFEAKRIFDCYKGIDDEHFITNNLIIELPFSSSFMMSVVSGLILSRMFRYKSANPDLIRYKNIIVMEDIQGVMNNV